jgi:hypothetical protein
VSAQMYFCLKIFITTQLIIHCVDDVRLRNGSSETCHIL